jgi:hypothetical protein
MPLVWMYIKDMFYGAERVSDKSGARGTQLKKGYLDIYQPINIITGTNLNMPSHLLNLFGQTGREVAM